MKTSVHQVQMKEDISVFNLEVCVLWLLNAVNRFSLPSLQTANILPYADDICVQVTNLCENKHFNASHIPKVHTDIWWPRRRTKYKLQSGSPGSGNFNGFHSNKKKKIKLPCLKLAVTIGVDWTSDHHLSVFSIWKNQSKQWNVEMADKLWNKWASAASGHKKKG